MSLDLYTQEFDDRRAQFGSTQTIDPGVFTNFLSGTGKVAMQTFAQGARAVTMAAGGVASAVERIGAMHPMSNGLDTSMSDAIWKFHEDVSQRAVDYWTPSPGEVGVAGQVVGQLLATLPMVVASPMATVAATQLFAAEDLQRKGVDTGKAQAVGAIQAAGLGLGIWMPTIGQTLAQRVLAGGVGFNVAQGVATRAASGALLEGTAAGKDFEALDPTALTLDVLLGAAFGAIAHLNPRQRVEGAAMWKKLTDWGQTLKPSDVEALATLRQAQHANVDSLPGVPDGPVDVEAHVQRLKAALEQVLTDKPVDVENMPAPKVTPELVRVENDARNLRALQESAEEIRTQEGIATVRDIPPPTEGPPAAQSDEPPRIADMQPDGPEANRAAMAEDPLAMASERFVAERPDLRFEVTEDDGSVRVMSGKEFLDSAYTESAQLRDKANLVEVAAVCLFGKG